MISHPDWSDRRIAGASGLATKTVAALRRTMRDLPEPVRRVGKDGRARPVRTAEGRSRAAELIREDPTISLRDIARRTGISPGTARNVRQRLLEGLDPVPDCQREEAPVCGVGPPPEVPAGPEERRLLLIRLTRDPSLRQSGSGRALLRMLVTHHADARVWERLPAEVPSHSVPAILTLARTCAADWAGLAEEIESLLDRPTGDR
ncbi:winged helix-turn-helix domain-containing protein [Streptomyces sp. NPDC001985]|uniref:winged helix-turn-helix domain-containing protein n=1 Tax=Streptomyces sp. NPDC001985 TaxID=3154406 RepID=UPI00333007DE